MSYSYIAYIDESGDDGLRKFRSLGKSGSTNWLVISCCLTRYRYDLEFVRWRDEISSQGKRKHRNIHFRELTHSQKIMACQKMASFPLQVVSVLSNKTTIGAGVYKEKNQLYHYVTRYLIERLSWSCRDMRKHVPEGNGQVKIVFSRRGGMDYKDFRKYLERLKRKSEEDKTINIEWPVIDIDAVDAKDHSSNAGLQLADCAASAFFAAVDPDEFGNCESRYALELKPKTYNRKGNYLSYGVKTLPTLNEMSLSQQQKNFFKNFE